MDLDVLESDVYTAVVTAFVLYFDDPDRFGLSRIVEMRPTAALPIQTHDLDDSNRPVWQNRWGHCPAAQHARLALRFVQGHVNLSNLQSL